MKKRIARIQRWLNRLAAACENKKWDSAIAEVDCLSAEVRDMREAISDDMVSEPQERSAPVWGLKQSVLCLKVLAVALLIVMSTTLPLAIEADKPFSADVATAGKEKSQENLHWVTQEELELLQVLRADMSQRNNNNNSMGLAPKSLPVRTSARNSRAGGAVKQEKPAKKTFWAKEDILALVQVGEKALRGESSAIIVVK
ncbi:MAG: hypothetical protein Q4F74_06110 [Synergistaceae bacterium]|nr:hypothetical protein [Synergistaceae bacterium]